jgi:6-phosphogluconolactonase (cycloisomerase 2 family)
MKRMTSTHWGRRLLASSISFGLALGLVSCGTSNTVDFLYLLSSKSNSTSGNGLIDAYKVDSITGALTQITSSPFSSLGVNPLGIVTSPNGQYVYVINHDSNSIASFSIGDNAQLTALSQTLVTTPGTDPVAISINPAGTLLFVVDTYAPGYSATTPGPGAVVVYPISSSGALGTPVAQTAGAYYSVGLAPSAITILPNGDSIYVTDILSAAGSGCNAGQGGLVALSVSSSGVLAPITGSPYCAGVTPSSIAVHPIGEFLYVTDSAQDQIIGYHVQSDGSLLPFINGPISTGTFPDSIVVEPRGLYLYVANRFSSSSSGIQSYSIAGGSGVPSSTGTYMTEAYAQCIIVEPALARFVYTADYEGTSGITGYQLNPNTGMLTGTEQSPYGGSGLATCLAATARGNHPVIHVQGTAG